MDGSEYRSVGLRARARHAAAGEPRKARVSRRTAKPLLGWDIVARRLSNGQPIINLPQVVWLYPGVTMDWGPRYNENVQVFAVNLLHSVLPGGNVLTSCGSHVRRAVLDAAPYFAHSALLEMPREGGVISECFLRAWVRRFIGRPVW